MELLLSFWFDPVGFSKANKVRHRQATSGKILHFT